MNYSPQKVLKMFSLDESSPFSTELLMKGIKNNDIPNFEKNKNGRKKSWSPKEIGKVGKRFGFIKKPSKPTVICSFVTKGGVLKTSITLNLARMAALHNIKTCVVGLDMQGDITSALGFDREIEEEDSIATALNKISAIKGLPDLLNPDVEVLDLVQDTDLPCLSFIPETPELVNLERTISTSHRREFWLDKNVVQPLKSEFDLIILDASPNWNLLITNALVSCDLLVSPLECKINNFRNFQVFDAFISEFKSDMGLSFTHWYVPTRWQKQRKLSVEILEWYQSKVKNCSEHSIPESTLGEESSAMSLSVTEYAPGTPLALAYNRLIQEIFNLAKIKNLKDREGVSLDSVQATSAPQNKEVLNVIKP